MSCSNSSTSARFETSIKAQRIQVVEKKSYPLGVKDLSPVLRASRINRPTRSSASPTRPTRSLSPAKQSKEIAFNPKLFYASVGTAFPLYPQVMAARRRGCGRAWARGTPREYAGAKAYFDAHMKRSSARSRTAGPARHAWAGLEILQQTVETVGLDRKAMQEYIAKTEFKTILGPIKLQGRRTSSIPGTIAQWTERRIRSRLAAGAQLPRALPADLVMPLSRHGNSRECSRPFRWRARRA